MLTPIVPKREHFYKMKIYQNILLKCSQVFNYIVKHLKHIKLHSKTFLVKSGSS